MTFGIDIAFFKTLDKDLAFKRIARDIRSDFIFAPHFNVILLHAQEELYNSLSQKLTSKFSPKLPITIEVPKPNGFSRPGSILYPHERLVYQMIVDYIAPFGEAQINRNQVFSNVLIRPEDDENGSMFESSGKSYESFKEKIQELALLGGFTHALRADVASFFDRLYQHVIINLLGPTGASTHAVSFLDKFLLAQTQKDSHGIIQGVFPSDFLGNFYLCAVDSEHDLENISYVRYVDDIYIFFRSELDAIRHRVKLSVLLRKDGLTLNEAKTKLFEIDELIQDETEIDRLFDEAKEEISESGDGYGFTMDLADIFAESPDDVEEEEEWEAVKTLFDKEATGLLRSKIDRFCIPIFTNQSDNHALDYVLENYNIHPEMAQVYAKYLISLIESNPAIIEKVENILTENEQVFEYQRLWLYTCLTYSKEKLRDATIRIALHDLRNLQINECVRAIGAILIAKFGSTTYHRLLRLHYTSEPSEYVKSALIFCARYFADRDTCFTAWSGHSEINSLVVTAIKNQEKSKLKT